MEAVSRGAAEAGGHVIGVTCEQIESWRAVAPNRWVLEEMRFKTLRERLYALIDHCDFALVLPGGIGTLAELAAMWSQLQTGGIPGRRLILIGPEWKAVMEHFLSAFKAYVPEPYPDLLAFAPEVDTAYRMLEASEDFDAR
jgi:predicted Rossmann-fold nucleotide-binding protein